MKTRHPLALFTIEDLSSIYQIDESNEEEEINEEFDDQVQWAQADDKADIFIAALEENQFKQHFAISAFMHWRWLEYKGPWCCFKSPKQSNNFYSTFDGLSINTCASRTSIIVSNQYQVYCRTFNKSSVLKSLENRMIKNIRGRASSIGNVLIQVLLKYLNVAINVHVVVIEEDIPTLLFTEDLLDNGLHIFIQRRYVCLEERRQPLTMENYVLISQWSPADVSYVLYTEE